jgi:hypothetical protein
MGKTIEIYFLVRIIDKCRGWVYAHSPLLHPVARRGAYDDFLGEREHQFQLVITKAGERRGREPKPTTDQYTEIIVLFEEYHRLPQAPSIDKANDDWEKFQDFMTSTMYSHQKVIDEFPWQCWQLSRQDVNYETGLDNCYHVALFGGAGTLHRYDGIPDAIEKQLLPEKQDDVNYYLGALDVRVIDAICSVPALPEHFDAPTSAEWAANSKLGVNKWQRRMNPDRVMAINTWAEGNPTNHILNSVLLYVPPEAFKQGVELTDDGVLKLSFDFLWCIAGNIYSDWAPVENKRTQKFELEDRRPIWILDGQHRTRGLALSKRGSKMRIPITVLTSQGEGGISKSEAAKLFTEINTLGESLEERMKFFLCNRFETAGRGDTDFADPNEPGIDTKRRKRRRANRETYRLAAKMCSAVNGPLYGSIRIQEENSGNKCHVDIITWMQEVRGWFLSDPYPMGGMNRDDFQTEVNNYFEAWRTTCNHGSWRTDALVPRWVSDRGRSHAYWETLTAFKSLLKMYPWLIKEIEEKNPKETRPYTQRVFKKSLKPVMHVDWKDPNFLKVMKKGAEPTRTFVMQWVQNAIENGQQHMENIAMSTDSDLAKDPGKAIMSKPHESSLLNSPIWPRPNQPSVIILQRPLNTLNSPSSISNISAFSNDGEVLVCEDNYDKNSGIFEIQIGHSKGISKSNEIDLRGDWTNPNGTTSFHYKINK